MPFTVSDFEDLVRILQERPEWRERLRTLILPEEILTLPQLVRENTGALRELRQTVMELVEAPTSIPALLRRQGYTAPKADYPVSIDSVGEVDVVLPVTSPQGEQLTVVAEIKLRLGERAVIDWANRMRSEEFRCRLREAGVPGPYLVYMYAIRVDPAAIEQAHAEGVGVMSGRGILVEPRESLPEV